MQTAHAEPPPRAWLAGAPRTVRYAIAGVTMLVTFLVTLAVGRSVRNFVGDLFYLAVGAISWFLGPDAALLSIALAAAGVAYLTPETPFPSVEDVLYLTLFVSIALAVLHLSRTQRRAWAIAELRAREASEANDAKDRFLDLVSHDLRGPLQGIKLWLKVIMHERFDPAKVQGGCLAIEHCARDQERLVADLLDAARVRAGTVALKLRLTQLRPIITRALETIAPAAKVKGLSLAAPEGAIDAPVLADPDRLVQVFWNLLTNAVKFTDPGGTVAVVVEQRLRTVEIHVRDTGRGLSPEDCRHAFEPYWQQQRGEGLGLGLLIARRLIELHGGALSVASPGKGKGADFAVALPVQDVRAA